MAPPAVHALGRPVWARVTLPHSASLDGTPAVGREVSPRAEGAPGACCQTAGSNVLPLTAPAAESVWLPRLLKGVNLVPGSEKSDFTLAEAAESRLA